MNDYREPARTLAEPAPFNHPGEACPICGACPWLLYFHDADCEWWIAYLAAGKRMRRGRGTDGVKMTVEEMVEVRAMRPKPPKPPRRWLRDPPAPVVVATALAMLVALCALLHAFTGYPANSPAP